MKCVGSDSFGKLTLQVNDFVVPTGFFDLFEGPSVLGVGSGHPQEEFLELRGEDLMELFECFAVSLKEFVRVVL